MQQQISLANVDSEVGWQSLACPIASTKAFVAVEKLKFIILFLCAIKGKHLEAIERIEGFSRHL